MACWNDVPYLQVLIYRFKYHKLELVKRKTNHGYIYIYLQF